MLMEIQDVNKLYSGVKCNRGNVSKVGLVEGSACL